MTPAAFLMGMLAATSAFAVEGENQTRMSGELPPNPRRRDELAGFEPTAGMMGYTDGHDEISARPIGGVLGYLNFSRTLPDDAEMTFFGLQSGVLYSYLDRGTTFLLFPANLLIGWNYAPTVRLCFHGGANIVYISQPGALILGASAGESGDPWHVQGDVGLDIQGLLSKDIGLTLRPDWTFSRGAGFLLLTLAVSFKLG